MNKPISVFIAAFFLFTSCNRQEPKTETTENNSKVSLSDSFKRVTPAEEFARLNSFLKKFETPSQYFQVKAKNTITIKCRQGTIFHIKTSDLETENGQPVSGNIDIEVKELFGRRQFLTSNVQTVSDGELLVSGGAVYVNLTSGGQKIKLKEGKKYLMEFPKLTDQVMSLYYGQRDSSNQMNWKIADRNFVSQKENKEDVFNAIAVLEHRTHSDSMIIPMTELTRDEYRKFQKESKLVEKIYAPVSLNKFGWINCDRLFKPDAPRTKVQFVVANKVEEVNYVNVYLIFKEINSVIQSSYSFYDNKIEKEDFDNIPVGMKVEFLAVCYQKGKIFATLTNETTVMNNHNEQLLLKEMSEKDFDKLLQLLD
jgi:hypothetical protein